MAVFLPSSSFAANTATFTGSGAINTFGQSMAMGDFDGDGFEDLVVGASNGSYIAITYGTGAILSSTTVSTDTAVVITGASSSDFFGVNLASGDVNGDGYDDILVGATTSSSAGAVYLIYGKATPLTSGAVESDSANIKFTGTSENLGVVALDDLNGDGFADLVIGARLNSTSSESAGAVYILYGRSSTFTTGSMASVASFQFTGEAAADKFGSSLAVGDLNGDGLAEVVAGAPNNDDAGIDAGAVYIVYGSTTLLSGSASIGASASKLTGEVAGDLAGKAGGLAISAQSIDGDSYNDLLVGATQNDDGAINAGAVYIVPGSAASYSTLTSLGSSSFHEIINGVSGSGMPASLATGDFNQDGLGDLVIGAPYISSGTGTVYVIPGSASQADLNLTNATEFVGSSAGDTFGTTVAVGDLNGDHFPELLMGAVGYNSGDRTGAVLIDYPYIDADLDGMPGTEGVFSEIDTTLFNANVTFDTNDTIPNNGVEIDGDEIDNDGDGEIDEHNTIAENGAHPYYSTLAAVDNSSENIISVVGGVAGQVTVTYADDSIYDYTVFSTTTSHTTIVDQYKKTGYAVVLKRSGTKAVLLDLYTGEKVDAQDLSKSATNSASLLLDDVRNDGKTEAVVTTKTKSKVKVFLIQVKKKTGKINLYDKLTVYSKKVDTSKTRTHKKKLQLRSATNKVLITLNVNKSYQLSEQVSI